MLHNPSYWKTWAQAVGREVERIHAQQRRQRMVTRMMLLGLGLLVLGLVVVGVAQANDWWGNCINVNGTWYCW